MEDSSFVKQEFVKSELEDAPGGIDVDDVLDDAGDLEFPPDGSKPLYLARIPKTMWQAWANMLKRLGDNDEIQLGTIRISDHPILNPDGSPVYDHEGKMQVDQKLSMLLNASCPEHQTLPREYQFDVVDRAVQNHFIFSEEVPPELKERHKARKEAQKAGIPPSLLRAKNPEGEKRTYDRRSRYQPYYRKPEPRKTKIFGRVAYDVRVEPKHLEEEEQLLAKRIFEVENSGSKLQIISRNKATSIVNPGSIGAVNWGTSFAKQQAQKPKKGEVFKAARIPKDQLLDLIFGAFKEYQYWSMKALRQRTQQPDAYLRQVLEEVAVLIKSGSFANHYTLSEAYRDKAGADSKEAAAEAADDGADEEEEEMEDVLPSH